MRKKKKERKPKAVSISIERHKTAYPWLGLISISIVVLLIHLWNPAIYSRELIHLDDGYYVYPLGQMSISYYLREWLFRPGTLSYPIRDATFGLDFWLSRHLGIQTFVITSTLLLLLYGFQIFKLFRLRLSDKGSLWLVAIILLHPLNVEVLQWVISRKHLLVGLWTALSVPVVMRLREGAVRTQGVSWFALGVLYTASVLSHPTGVLFPLWVAIALYGTGRLWSAGALAYLGYCVLMGGGWTALSATINPDYGSLANLAVGRRDWWSLLLENGVQGMGRLIWQLIFPFQQSVYFDPGDPRNFLGAGIALGGVLSLAGGYFWKYKRCTPLRQLVTGEAGLSGLLALILFTPQGLFLLRRDDFPVADRFLFLPLPYVLLSLALAWNALNSREQVPSSGKWRFLPGKAALAIVLVLYSIISAKVTPVWNDAVTLARHCIEGVNAPRCWELLVQELGTQGCPTLMSDEKSILQELERRALENPSPFLVEGFASLAECYATMSAPGIEERQRMVESLAIGGSPPEGLANARGLLLLERGKLENVGSLINDVFLVNGPRRINYLTPTRLGHGLGQLQVVCLAMDQLKMPMHSSCRQLVRTFQQLFGGNLLRESEVVEARMAALESLRRGGIVVTPP